MTNKEIIIVMGYPASGKTMLAKEYETQGHYRVNKDELGGSLSDLVKHVEHQYINNRTSQFVMDNTYPTIESKTNYGKLKKLIFFISKNPFS